MKRFIPFIFSILLFATVNAQFTANNLVVYKVGDGSAALTNAATVVSLKEYAPSGTATGYALTLPTAGGTSITASGSSTSEGQMSLSSNAQYIMATGYASPAGTLAVSTSTAARVVLRVSADGTYDATTQLAAATNYNGNNFRSAASSNGTDIWTAGTASTAANAGIRYTTLGSTTSTQLVSATTNIRVANIFSNQLFYTTGSGTPGVYSVGTGLPTATGQTATPIVTYTSGSPYNFAFFDDDLTIPGVDLLYLADDGTTTQGLRKYAFDGTTWVDKGLIATAVRGLCAKKSSSGYTIYATDNANIYTFADNSGRNASLSGTLTSIATAGTNSVFRGICFSPGSSTIPVELTNFTAQKANTAAKLIWSTATELNNARYDIERSSNGKTFDKIGEVAGYGNSNQARTYTFMDEKPNVAVNYYRLRQVDFDGKETISKAVSVNFDKNASIKVYPNVAKDKINIDITGDGGAADLSITNLLGQVVLTQKLQNTEGSLSVNVNELASGSYIVRVVSKGIELTQRFEKQ